MTMAFADHLYKRCHFDRLLINLRVRLVCELHAELRGSCGDHV